VPDGPLATSPDDTTPSSVTARAYARLVRSEVQDPADVEALPGDADEHVAHNAVLTVGSLTLTKIGDRIVDAKTVLTWLVGAVGAPAAITGLLVPIRESGALLPQVLVARFVAGRPRRRPTWLAGAIGQGVAVAAMALIALTLGGVAAGVALLVALAAFATFRSVCSLTIKDVMGRTIPTGERGQVTGWATTASGLVAITVGLGIRALGQDAGTAVFAGLLAAAAVLWFASAAVFLRVREPAVPDDRDAREGVTASLRLLVTDAPFRRFVLARTLLLVSALTPPYVVVLAQESTGSAIAGLGPFVVAAGVASLVGGRLWGPFADRSSRRLIAIASGTASVIAILFVVVTRAGLLVEQSWWYVVTYFALALVHEGARLGRSTYVVDLGDTGGRTDYVAVSNTAMGVLLLVVGAASSVVALLGPTAAMLMLAGIGLVGVPVSLSMDEVGAGRLG
jgi:hypothetical protein